MPKPPKDQTPDEYGRANVVVYDVQARYYNTYSDDKVPGIAYKVKNKGNRTLNLVQVTFYFKDRNDKTIAEATLQPVGVSSYSSDPPLKPGYIWQSEPGRFYKAKNVPTEWVEGAVEYKVTEIEFGNEAP